MEGFYTQNWQHIVLRWVGPLHRPIPLWHVFHSVSAVLQMCSQEKHWTGQFLMIILANSLACNAADKYMDLPGPWSINDLPRKHMIKTTFVPLLPWKMALKRFPMQDWDEYKTYKVENYLTGAFGISMMTRQDCLTACDFLGTLGTFARWRAQMGGASRLCENTAHAS